MSIHTFGSIINNKRKKNTIHTFGDSHSVFGWKNCRNVESHHIGAILCYSFGQEKLNRCDISNFDLKYNDSVVFCFGEIDCRCHIHKHVTDEKSYKMIIDEIVYNYTQAIKMNIDHCKIKLKNVCIYNVVPPIQKHTAYDNPKYPFIGSDEDRKKYVLYFNKCLKKECEKNKWFFFDVYNSYVNKNGFLNKKFSDGSVHIKDGRFLNQVINNYLL